VFFYSHFLQFDILETGGYIELVAGIKQTLINKQTLA